MPLLTLAFGVDIRYAIGASREQPHHGVFLGEPTNLRTVAGIARDAVGLIGRGLIHAGLLLLIATPVARS